MLMSELEHYHTLATPSQKENTPGDNSLLHEVFNPQQES